MHTSLFLFRNSWQNNAILLQCPKKIKKETFYMLLSESEHREQPSIMDCVSKTMC